MSEASPSVMHRSGSKVARASRPADHGDGADGVGQDLAVAAEALGHRDHADLGPGDVDPLVTTARTFAGTRPREVDPLGPERGPRLGVAGRGGVAAAGSLLVAAVVGSHSVKWAPPGASTTPSTIMRLIRIW